MEGIPSKIYGFILIIILLIIIPTYYQLWIIDKIVYSRVDNITYAFNDNVRKSGYISRKMYEDFLKQLAGTKRIYSIEMRHDKVKYYPISTDNKKFRSEKPWMELKDEYTEKQILEKLYDKAAPSDYLLSKGDNFSVKVIDKNPRILSIIFNNLKTSIINITYGGMVYNEIN